MKLGSSLKHSGPGPFNFVFRHGIVPNYSPFPELYFFWDDAGSGSYKFSEQSAVLENVIGLMLTPEPFLGGSLPNPFF
jgi:hypothetical protein